MDLSNVLYGLKLLIYVNQFFNFAKKRGENRLFFISQETWEGGLILTHDFPLYNAWPDQQKS